MKRLKNQVTDLGEPCTLRGRFGRWFNDTENRSAVLPFTIFGIFALICYFLFCHHDILMTAQHSYGYLNGRFTDFYTASSEMDGEYGSNYLPLTFILFALWNLPLKLLGAAPEFFGDWDAFFALWNKLLPVIFLFGSACVMYRLAFDRLQFGRGKAILASMMLLMSPYAFFSQFLFSQYDSLVVFFMLLGLYFFFKAEMRLTDWVWFSIFFGLATSFKYFAAVIFFVFLVLKEKNVLKVLRCAVIFALPLAAQFGVYFLFDRHAFVESIFNFSALEYTEDISFATGIGSVSLVYLALIMIIAFAYFTNADDDYAVLGWGSFYSCGVCFVLFGLMTWHPQWLMFAVPFWTLSTMINRRWEMFMLLDSAAAVVFTALVAKVFHHQVDDNLFRYGILSGELRLSQSNEFPMAALFRFIDSNLLFTLLIAVFAVSFIFKHPRFNMKKANEPMPRATLWITARFLCGVLIFLIPAFVCLPSFLRSDTYLWANFSGDEETEECVLITENSADIAQYLSLQGEEIHAIYVQIVQVGMVTEESDCLSLRVLDAGGRVLGVATVFAEDVEKEELTEFRFDTAIPIDENATYRVELSTNATRTYGVVIGVQERPTYRYYNVLTQDYSESRLIYQGEMQEAQVGLVMSIYGDH